MIYVILSALSERDIVACRVHAGMIEFLDMLLTNQASDESERSRHSLLSYQPR